MTQGEQDARLNGIGMVRPDGRPVNELSGRNDLAESAPIAEWECWTCLYTDEFGQHRDRQPLAVSGKRMSQHKSWGHDLRPVTRGDSK